MDNKSYEWTNKELRRIVKPPARPEIPTGSPMMRLAERIEGKKKSKFKKRCGAVAVNWNIVVSVLSAAITIGAVYGRIDTLQKMTDFRLSAVERKIDEASATSLNFAQRISTLEGSREKWRDALK